MYKTTDLDIIILYSRIIIIFYYINFQTRPPGIFNLFRWRAVDLKNSVFQLLLIIITYILKIYQVPNYCTFVYDINIQGRDFNILIIFFLSDLPVTTSQHVNQ